MTAQQWGFQKSLSRNYHSPLQVCDAPPEIEALAHRTELTADDITDLYIENCTDLC